MVAKARLRVNLDFPVFNLQPQLMKIGKDVIVPDIQGRMNQGIDLEDKTYRQLAESTIKTKQRRGYRTEPLLATGQLRKSPKVSKDGKRAVRITPAGMRKSTHGEKVISNRKLADILQNQGVRAKAGERHFEFFGISEKAEIKTIKTLEQYIKDSVKRGGRKIVR